MGMGNSDDERVIMERNAHLEKLRELGISEYTPEMTDEEKALYEAHLLNQYRLPRKE